MEEPHVSLEGVSAASLAECLLTVAASGTCRTQVICGGRKCVSATLILLVIVATASLTNTSSRYAGGSIPTSLPTSSSGGVRIMGARQS